MLYLQSLIEKAIDAWLSLVERCVRDAEVAGSNPVASTLGRGAGNTDKYSISGIFLFLTNAPKWSARFQFFVCSNTYSNTLIIF